MVTGPGCTAWETPSTVHSAGLRRGDSAEGVEGGVERGVWRVEQQAEEREGVMGRSWARRSVGVQEHALGRGEGECEGGGGGRRMGGGGTG